MPRSRPASDPISFHKATGQFYVTRGGKRVYLGCQHADAMTRYHRLALGELEPPAVPRCPPITVKNLANRFLAAQQANWTESGSTFRGYKFWLQRCIEDHPGLLAEEFTVEMFAAWKLSLRQREYAQASINHFLKAVRAMYVFAEDAGLIEHAPRLRRIKNEHLQGPGRQAKSLYSGAQLVRLLKSADVQMRLMILLGLNCGFGPKDIEDMCWIHLKSGRVSLRRSKTGIEQVFCLWPDTLKAFADLKKQRKALVMRLAKRGRLRSDADHVFVTKFWRPWYKDAVAGQFRKLCKRAKVPCHGFYRLRHCASTAMSLVATPHVHRKFMRHAQLQQQVTYTHTPDTEVDEAVMRARAKLLPRINEGPESDPRPAEAV